MISDKSSSCFLGRISSMFLKDSTSAVIFFLNSIISSFSGLISVVYNMPNITQGGKMFYLPHFSLQIFPHFSTLLHGNSGKYLNKLLFLLLFLSPCSLFNQDFIQIILLNRSPMIYIFLMSMTFTYPY